MMTEKFYLIDGSEHEYESLQSLAEEIRQKILTAPKRVDLYDYDIKLRTIINEKTGENKTCAFAYDKGTRGVI